MKLKMRGEDGASAEITINNFSEAKTRTAEWLAEGDYDPLDAPVDVRGHYSIDDEPEQCVRICLTGGDMISGYDYEIIN
jgi:hypothetical protein